MKSSLYCLGIIMFLALPFTIARSVFGGMMCHKESDCSEDKCCAMIAMTKSHTGFCMPAKQLGDRCAPTFIYGKSFTCGCKRGLSCALVEVNRATRMQKHRCVQVLPDPVELRQQTNNTVPQVTSLTAESLTADLFREILKDLQDSDPDDNDERKAT